MLLLAGLILAGGRAWALTVNYAACALQADNTLRFDCTITTSSPSDVYIQFGKDTTLACESGQVTPTSLNKYTHTITMYGMKASSVYDWRAHAVPAGGGTPVLGACGHTSTGALPAGIGTTALASLDINHSGTADQVHNFLTEYGCSETPNDSDARDAFIIVDEDDNIVWYQEPLAGMAWGGSTPPILEAIGLARPSKHITGIVNHEIIVEYDLTGKLLHLICRDDGSTYCPNTDATPDLFFDGGVYVHHDVQIVNNHLFVLNAKERVVPDTDDCDGDSNTTEDQYIILDGVYVFDLAGPTLEVDWDWTDTSGVTVDYSTANGLEETPHCESRYWLAPDGRQLNGTDYLHTNSLWVDAAQQWMLSAHDLDYIYTVDRDPMSYTYNQVVDEMDGKGLGGDWTFDATLYPGEFYGQHAPHWGPLSDLVLFDNHTGGDTRGVVYDLDTTGMTLEAIEQYTMEDLSASPISCGFGGSAWLTLGGNAFLACPDIGGKALLNEFDGSDSVNWAVEMECDTSTFYDPVGFAFRAYANVL